MNVKDELLSILLSSEDGVSGSELAERIGCSRMAISKSAAGLADEGYRISVSRSGGYRLEKSDVLSLPVLNHYFDIPVYYRPVCKSTMTEAKDLINKGIEAPFAVIAGRQEGGRGRLGRSFFSPEGGVYLSLVISGKEIPNPDMLTTAASLAVSRAIEALTGIGCSIKWVNDIYIHGRKAVGILTEGLVNMEEGGLDKAVVGIGVNLQPGAESIPPELKEKINEVNDSIERRINEGPVMREIKKKASALNKIIVLCEGEDARVVKAAADATEQGIAKIILLGDPEKIAKDNPNVDLTGVTVIDPAKSEKRAEYAALLYALRKAKGMTEEEAETFCPDVRIKGEARKVLNEELIVNN